MQRINYAREYPDLLSIGNNVRCLMFCIIVGQQIQLRMNSVAPVVSILATGTRVRGFKPGRSRWIFRASFGVEVK
jgi:hypothetical protein